MPTVHFTKNLQIHVACPTVDAPGTTVREALDAVFTQHPRVRSYVLDDLGRVRKHMSIFLDGQMIADRDGLSDRVEPTSEIYVMQALSGG